MTSPMFGRDAQLAILQRELSRTFDSGKSTVVLVRGEPGIGKSTLLKSLIDSVPAIAGSRPVLVGYGQAMTNSLGSDAFQAIRECLRSLVSNAERSAVRGTLERVAQAIRLHAPDWLESIPLVGALLAAGVKTGRTAWRSADSSEHLHSRLDQLIALVEALFSSGPVVLVLDDLHWADNATIDIVMALALKVDGPLMLLLGYRSDDLRRGPGGEPHPLEQALFRLRRYRPGCVELELTPLAENDIRSLIATVDSDSAISDGELQSLVRLSAGVPLFAESLVEWRRRADSTEPETASSPPRQIAVVFQERLSFAAPADQRLLEAAIVVGFTFEVEFVAALTRTDPDQVYDQLDVLMREHHLIVEAEPVGNLDRYAFSHPLLADVIERRAAANAARRRRYHQRLVDILVDQPASDELAVRMATAAVVAQDPRATELSVVAAGRQYRAGAITKARELAQAALSAAAIDPASAFSFEAAELLARSMSAEANHREAAIVCDQALSQLVPGTIAPERVWELMLLRVRSLRMINAWDDAEHLASALHARLPPDADRVRAEILMLQAEFALCGPEQDTERCIRLCDQVAALDQDSELTSRAFGHCGLAHLAAYRPDDAEYWLTAAIDLARADHHPYAAYEATHWLSKKKIACLELDEAWTLLRQLAETSQASGVASDSPFHRRDASRVLGLHGDTHGAGATFVQFFDLVSGHELDRALTVLVCQIAEMDTRYGTETSDRMLDLIAGAVTEVTAPAHRRALAESVRQLPTRPPGWQPVWFAVDRLGVNRGEAQAAEAIFRFDVPDLAHLRDMVAHR